MNRNLISLGLLLIATATNAQNWITTLNEASATNPPKLGTRNDQPLRFYTKNIQQMVLTSKGYLGISVSEPSAFLHVGGEGIFTGGVRVGGILVFNGEFSQRFTKSLPGSGLPDIFYTGNNPSGTNRYKQPCNVWYKDPMQMTEGQDPTNTPWTPSVANVIQDLIQITPSNVTPLPSAMSIGVLANGDGVIAVEPVSAGFNPKLKINSGCANDVLICEGGGMTKIFGDAWINFNLDVTQRMRINSTGPFSQTSFEIKTSGSFNNAINILNPLVSGTNKRVFEVKNTGAVIAGSNITPSNAMVTIGHSVAATPALLLTNNQTTTNRDYFSVLGNGYTEINIYSPTAMPANRVFAIKDKANTKDLFVVKADGKVYAREVEILNVATFPDYVFEKGYDLKPIAEVEQFVSDNKHLPGFEKGSHYETNGINVTDLLLKQQQQLEEQMLYIIQLEKRLKSLEQGK